MSIKHAILGILSYKPLTGYDLKKIIQDSPFMYWSGNNNQIYKALLELDNEGYVSSEVKHQEGSPSKKIYKITEEGLAELKNWLLSTLEPPEFKKTFLIQLAWADQLNTDELNTLLCGYENQLHMQLLLQKEYKRRKKFSPGRTTREESLYELIHDNLISSYENELGWMQKVRQKLGSNTGKERNKMQSKVVEMTKGKFVECISAEIPLRTEQDALDLVSLCGENGTHYLLLHANVLAEDFFNLRTGIAGGMLQKFANYHVKAAVVLADGQHIMGKFKELLAESHRGSDFRMFPNRAEAEKWLSSIQ